MKRTGFQARRTLGSQKLTQYLELNGLSDDAFGEQCKKIAKRRLHRTRIHAYRTGRAMPWIPQALAIETATAGAIAVADWTKPPLERIRRRAA